MITENAEPVMDPLKIVTNNAIQNVLIVTYKVNVSIVQSVGIYQVKHA